jgi:hypothetical protein
MRYLNVATLMATEEKVVSLHEALGLNSDLISIRNSSIKMLLTQANIKDVFEQAVVTMSKLINAKFGSDEYGQRVMQVFQDLSYDDQKDAFYEFLVEAAEGLCQFSTQDYDNYEPFGPHIN